MHPDSTTPPEEEAREDPAASELPSSRTWQRLDEELPDWCTWTTLAEVAQPLDGSDETDSPPDSVSSSHISDHSDRDEEGALLRNGRTVLSPPGMVARYNHRPINTHPPPPRRLGRKWDVRQDAMHAGDTRPMSGDGYGPTKGSEPTVGGAAAESQSIDESRRGALQCDWRTVDKVLDGGASDERLDRAGKDRHAGASTIELIYSDGFDGSGAAGVGEDHADTGTIEPIHGDGFDGSGAASARADHADKGTIEPIHGDGFAAIGSVGNDDENDPKTVNPVEPWDDLSQYTQVDLPERRSTSASAGEDVDTGEEFSPLDLRDRVVIMLLFKQLVRIEDVQKARRRWMKQSGRTSKEPLWRVLTTDPSFDREIVFAEAAQVYAFNEAQVEKKAAAAFIKRQKDRFADALWDRMSKLRVLPVKQEMQANGQEKRLIFISHDPSRSEVNALVRDLGIESFELQYAPEAEIDALILEAFPKRNEFLDRVSDDEFAFDLGTSYDRNDSLIDEDALEAEISRSSLINLFEAALVEAVRLDVSDIHIFPNPRKQIEIHFRIDGELECWHREERVHPEALLAVVKDNTHNVDRFERDTAQDGFIQRKVDDTLIRYRVSVLPVANANQEIRSESIVIRVLDDRKVITDLGKLGLLDGARSKFEWAIRQPHGMVILTGPTGSGKTTTLFAAMHQVVTPKVNVLTVEDPVEYVIPGVRQIKLSHKLELEQALRSILRHDPDIVMVGEMRDRPTADLAIKLANTGHLTFSTLHTNDAPSAVSRLFKMGVEPFLIAYAINLVVAQRLLRTLCAHCKRPADRVDDEMLRRLGFTPQEIAQTQFFVEGNRECRACGGSGYSGRRAITETMAFTDEIRRKIVLSNEIIDEDGLRRQAIADGMLTLRASAREVVKQGETSVEELIRVTAGEH